MIYYHMTAEEWEKTPSDYKSIIKGQKKTITLLAGGTTLVPVRIEDNRLDMERDTSVSDLVQRLFTHYIGPTLSLDGSDKRIVWINYIFEELRSDHLTKDEARWLLDRVMSYGRE
jgi:hypothetical protein